MPFEPELPQIAATSHTELDSLIERVVELTIARVNGAACKPFLNSRECADLISCTPEHLCAMRARGEGPPWSGAGKWVRYDRHAVLSWIANLPQQPSASAFDRLLAATQG